MYAIVYPQTKTGTSGTQRISWRTVGNKEKIHSDHSPSLQTRQVRRQNTSQLFTIVLQGILLFRQPKTSRMGGRFFFSNVLTTLATIRKGTRETSYLD